MAQQSSPPHPRLPRTGGRFGARRRLIVAAAVLALALSALAGAAGARDGRHAAGPTKGGTLKLLGTSDIFNLDTVSAYYTVSSLLERTFARQLVSYPNAATFPASIKIVPDIATAVPTKGNGISADGKTYTFKLRSGVHVEHDAGARGHCRRFRARVQDALQPGGAERGARLLHEHDRGHEGLLRRLRQGQGRPSRRSRPTSRPIRSPAWSPRIRRRSCSSCSARRPTSSTSLPWASARRGRSST